MQTIGAILIGLIIWIDLAVVYDIDGIIAYFVGALVFSIMLLLGMIEEMRDDLNRLLGNEENKLKDILKESEGEDK